MRPTHSTSLPGAIAIAPAERDPGRHAPRGRVHAQQRLGVGVGQPRRPEARRRPGRARPPAPGARRPSGAAGAVLVGARSWPDRRRPPRARAPRSAWRAPGSAAGAARVARAVASARHGARRRSSRSAASRSATPSLVTKSSVMVCSHPVAQGGEAAAHALAHHGLGDVQVMGDLAYSRSSTTCAWTAMRWSGTRTSISSPASMSAEALDARDVLVGQLDALHAQPAARAALGVAAALGVDELLGGDPEQPGAGVPRVGPDSAGGRPAPPRRSRPSGRPPARRRACGARSSRASARRGGGRRARTSRRRGRTADPRRCAASGPMHRPTSELGPVL